MQPTSIVNLDLTGFQTISPTAWMSPERAMVQIQFFNLVPDLPAPLTEIDRLRRELTLTNAEKGGTVIEMEVVMVGGLPALWTVAKIKLPNQPTGQAFLGTCIIPKANCSVVLMVQAIEEGTTGIREAVVVAQVGPDNFYRPHPYAPDVQGGLPSHVADDRNYDPQFPDHPLTRVRQVMGRLVAQATLHPVFATISPFGS